MNQWERQEEVGKQKLGEMQNQKFKNSRILQKKRFEGDLAKVQSKSQSYEVTTLSLKVS